MKNMKRSVRRWCTKKIRRKRLKKFYETYCGKVVWSKDDPNFPDKRGDGKYSETPCWCSGYRCSNKWRNDKKRRWIMTDEQWKKDYYDEYNLHPDAKLYYKSMRSINHNL